MKTHDKLSKLELTYKMLCQLRDAEPGEEEHYNPLVSGVLARASEVSGKTVTEVLENWTVAGVSLKRPLILEGSLPPEIAPKTREDYDPDGVAARAAGILPAILFAILFFASPLQAQELPEGDGAISAALFPDVERFEATIIKVYDGDTFTAIVRLGFDTFVEAELRLDAIDAPELRGEERKAGLVTRDYVRKVMLNRVVVIEGTGKRGEVTRGKFGRWIVGVFVDLDTGHPVDLGAHLIQKQLATEYDK